MTDDLDKALKVLGIEASDLDPDVVKTLRSARPKQLDRKDLARMSPGQITEAERAGKLDNLLGRQKDA